MKRSFEGFRLGRGVAIDGCGLPDMAGDCEGLRLMEGALELVAERGDGEGGMGECDECTRDLDLWLAARGGE